MIRSRRCVFVSHCLLAQGIRADGLAKYHPAAFAPVVEWCLTNEINIMQMPCPELACASGGLGRSPRGKKWYEKNGLRETATAIAGGQAAYMKRLVDGGYTVIGIIGMEFSPACATRLLNRGRRVVHDEGIYIEELRKALKAADLKIPLIGVHPRGPHRLQKDLKTLIEPDLVSELFGNDETV